MKYHLLVNNIVKFKFAGIYNYLVECASFKSWSSFILVQYTAFEFKVGFSI